MKENDEAKPKSKGFFATLKESVRKTSEGCGPDCGCHVKKQEKVDGSNVAEKTGKN